MFGHLKQAGAHEAAASKDGSPQKISSVTVTANNHVTNTGASAQTRDASTLSGTELLPLDQRYSVCEAASGFFFTAQLMLGKRCRKSAFFIKLQM